MIMIDEFLLKNGDHGVAAADGQGVGNEQDGGHLQQGHLIPPVQDQPHSPGGQKDADGI